MSEKIKKLYIKHFKGIREVDIYPDPTCQEIAGENAAGKSSVLDSIVASIAGKRAIDPRPLRDGEGKGEIKDVAGKKLVSVFVPTTPNPTSGIFLLVPYEEATFLDMSVEEGLKIVVSSGTITPSLITSSSQGNAPGA